MTTRHIFRTLLIFIFLIEHCSFASDIQGNTICLNMIVKNESEVIQRCLASVKPFIDYWVIVDTGSTDGTQEIIKEFLKDIPGELYQRPWINFAHNRNEALQLAKFKTNYALIMDADDFLTYPPDYKFLDLDKDSYYLTIEDCGTKYYRTQLINNHLNWSWVGVLHEYLTSSEAQSSALLSDVKYVRYYDGARSKDPQKYLKDAYTLENALKKDPLNNRYVFYLAECYKGAQQYEKAIENYAKRVAMKGWEEEVFWSLLQIGILKELLNRPSTEIIEAYVTAFNYRPSRLEPLFYLCRYYRYLGHFHASYALAQQGLTISMPNDLLFVEHWIYDYALMFEYSISAYWVEDYRESLRASNLLLENPNLPADLKEYVLNNLEWIKPRANAENQ